MSSVASRFERATVEMMRARALLRRTDTKFLVPADLVIWLLAGITSDYRLLLSGDRVLARYHTVYYDTPDLLYFNDHRRGRRPRHKVRIRHYLDRRQTYFEIKTKQANGMTNKYRRRRAFGDESFGEQERALVSRYAGLPGGELSPSLVIDFSRMTLLGKHTEERMTIDLHLAFDGAGPRGDLDDVAVLEVKQRRLQRRTPIMRALRAHGIRPSSASKYCTALALNRPSVRCNHVRPILRAMERMHP